MAITNLFPWFSGVTRGTVTDIHEYQALTRGASHGERLLLDQTVISPDAFIITET